jgi:hypothetical protein
MMVCYFIIIIIIIIIIIYKEYYPDCMFHWTDLLGIYLGATTAQQFSLNFYRHTWSLLDKLNSEGATVGVLFHILHYLSLQHYEVRLSLLFKNLTTFLPFINCCLFIEVFCQSFGL